VLQDFNKRNNNNNTKLYADIFISCLKITVSIVHLFIYSVKKSVDRTQLYNKTREQVKILQQFKHAITDKITSTNRINSVNDMFRMLTEERSIVYRLGCHF